jgi:mycobactin peptide synthetase MbtF
VHPASSGSPSTLPELLELAAAADPDAEALTDGRERLSWREYRDAAVAIGDALTARGVGPSDRVAVLMPKSARSFVAVHAV